MVMASQSQTMNDIFTFGAVLILCCMVSPCSSQSLDQHIKLMTTNLDGYDRRFRPILDQRQPIVVNVTFDLISLQGFDEVQEKFSVTGLMHMSWYDEKLAWNPWVNDFIFGQLYKVEDIWYPILVLTNPSGALKDIVEKWMTIRVVFNGLALFYPGAVYEATCTVDVTYYPFDTQTCKLNFVPWGIGLDEMILHSPNTRVLQTYFSENGEWTFTELTAEDGLKVGANSVTFTFKLKRKPTFLLVNIILPIVFMAAISVFVFVLPQESGERVSFSITVLLALAVFFTMIGDNLPKTSNPLSHLSYFLTIILVYSVVMCVIAVCNLRIYFKDENIPVPVIVAVVVRFLRCRVCMPTKRERPRMNQVDVIDLEIVKNLKEDPVEKSGIPEDAKMKFETSKKSQVTWKDVSSTIDNVCLVLFTVAISVTCSLYLYILINNKW